MGLSSSFNLAFMLLLLYFETHVISTIMCIVLGFCLCPNLLVWYSYSVEIAFPLKETTFSSVFLIMADIMGFVFSFGSNVFMEYVLTNEKGSIIVIVFWILIWILGTIISCFMEKINHKKIDTLRHLVSVAFDDNSIVSDHTR